MIPLKTCPKCHGDMYFQTDLHGPYWQCLQCGLLLDLGPAPMQGQLPVALKVTAKVATRRVR